MKRAALILLISTAALAAHGAAQAKPKRCVLRLLNADRKGIQDQPFGSNTIWTAGGNVQLRCDKQAIYFGGDSVYAINAEAVSFYSKAYYRDPDYTIAADTLNYTKQTELFKAIGHVVIHDVKNGSTLTGPYIEYRREAQGVRDSAEVLGLNRPTVRYYTQPEAGRAPGNPYVVVANVIHGFGKSRLRGIGDALIDRDSLHASGDSFSFQSGKSAVARLWGNPGIIRRASKDSFFVLGRVVILGLQDDKIRDLHAFGDAHVTNAGSQVVADSIAMAFSSEKLGLTLAWDRANGATVRNEGYFVRGDSVAIETPEEVLRELRVFHHGLVQNPTDSGRPVLVPKRTLEDTVESAIPDRDTMFGDRIVAKFVQVDSAGTKQTRLQNVQAIAGKGERARSFFARTVTKGSTTSPSVTYILADTIVVEMKHGDSTGVAVVDARGGVTGIQLETASKPKTAADSAKVPLPVKRP